MATVTSELTEVLNDLIMINYDRIEGYRKAAEESKEFDISLHPVFTKMADESRKNVSALTQRVRELGGDAESGSTTMGKIYRAWMDVKAAFSGNDRQTFLESCEYGEDQAQHAYDKALASDADIDTETRQMITSQKETLKRSHDEVKAMRDAGN
jgi:uncharacterized protein (TIGR02284 family)